MIRVHFLDRSGHALRSFSASALAVTDLVGARRLVALAAAPVERTGDASGSAAAPDRVAIELPAGTRVAGVQGPGCYAIDGLDPDEAERELLTEPGETGG